MPALFLLHYEGSLEVEKKTSKQIKSSKPPSTVFYVLLGWKAGFHLMNNCRLWDDCCLHWFHIEAEFYPTVVRQESGMEREVDISILKKQLAQTGGSLPQRPICNKQSMNRKEPCCVNDSKAWDIKKFPAVCTVFATDPLNILPVLAPFWSWKYIASW